MKLNNKLSPSVLLLTISFYLIGFGLSTLNMKDTILNKIEQLEMQQKLIKFDYNIDIQKREPLNNIIKREHFKDQLQFIADFKIIERDANKFKSRLYLAVFSLALGLYMLLIVIYKLIYSICFEYERTLLNR